MTQVLRLTSDSHHRRQDPAEWVPVTSIIRYHRFTEPETGHSCTVILLTGSDQVNVVEPPETITRLLQGLPVQVEAIPEPAVQLPIFWASPQTEGVPAK